MVGIRERVNSWPGMIGDVSDEVAKGEIVDDAGVGGRLGGEGMRVGVGGNGCFVGAEETHDSG